MQFALRTVDKLCANMSNMVCYHGISVHDGFFPMAQSRSIARKLALKRKLRGGLSAGLLDSRSLSSFPFASSGLPLCTSALGDEESEQKLMRMTKAELVELILQMREENTGFKSHHSSVCEEEEVQHGAVDFDSKEALIKALEDGIAWPEAGEQEFWNRGPRTGDDGTMCLSEDLQDTRNESYSANKSQSPIHIVHVTAEMAPLAKVGGLGDVVTGLAAASKRQGHIVDVILPFYECIDTTQIEDLVMERTFDSFMGREEDGGHLAMSTVSIECWTGKIEGCPVRLLKPQHVPYFRGGAIYGGSYNETEAYLIFCRASLEYMAQSGMDVDIIHAHEWQGAAVPMLFWELFSSRMPHARPILTIHNMDNTGECRQDEFAATGVSGSLFASVDKALDERTIGHNPERLCLLKGGIVYSSAVTTVSPTYAQETLTGGTAGFLQSTLAKPEVTNKYMGILNGIDTDVWNPATDPYLPACFSSHIPNGKSLCKKYLQRGLGMNEDPEKPLVAVISRLVPQKGIHLIEHAAVQTMEKGGQFVLLGTGHASGGLQGIAHDRFRDNKDMSMLFMYSEPLSHLIYAAADMFLVPSMFEPCGLTQMIALRYGGVPIVRRTGGLADTVRDVSASGSNDAAPPLRGNGFVFDGVDAGSLEEALDRAFSMYTTSPQAWHTLSTNNMKESICLSWDGSGASYEQLYLGCLNR